MYTFLPRQVMDWNQAAVERVVELTPEPRWPRCVRLLFYSLTPLGSNDNGGVASPSPSKQRVASTGRVAAEEQGAEAAAVTTGCLIGQVRLELHCRFSSDPVTAAACINIDMKKMLGLHR